MAPSKWRAERSSWSKPRRASLQHVAAKNSLRGVFGVP